MMRACLFFAAVLAVGDRCLAFTTVPSAASIRALGSTQVSDDSVTAVRRQTYAGFLGLVYALVCTHFWLLGTYQQSCTRYSACGIDSLGLDVEEARYGAHIITTLSF